MSGKDEGREAMFRPVEFPRSANYDPDWVLENMMGPNALWLTESLVGCMDLNPAMRILDLGCGKALSSIFLAREYGVQVWATDLWINATDNYGRICAAGTDALPARARVRKQLSSMGAQMVKIIEREFTDGDGRTRRVRAIVDAHIRIEYSDGTKQEFLGCEVVEGLFSLVAGVREWLVFGVPPTTSVVSAQMEGVISSIVVLDQDSEPLLRLERVVADPALSVDGADCIGGIEVPLMQEASGC